MAGFDGAKEPSLSFKENSTLSLRDANSLFDLSKASFKRLEKGKVEVTVCFCPFCHSQFPIDILPESQHDDPNRKKVYCETPQEYTIIDKSNNTGDTQSINTTCQFICGTEIILGHFFMNE